MSQHYLNSYKFKIKDCYHPLNQVTVFVCVYGMGKGINQNLKLEFGTELVYVPESVKKHRFSIYSSVLVNKSGDDIVITDIIGKPFICENINFTVEFNFTVINEHTHTECVRTFAKECFDELMDNIKKITLDQYASLDFWENDKFVNMLRNGALS